jgi:hypothetical protein
VNKTKENLYKLHAFMLEFPEFEVVFFVNTDDGGDHTYTQQEISSVVIDDIACFNGDTTIIGEDDILENIAENIFDEELNEAHGDRESVSSDEDIDKKAKILLDEYRKSGVVKRVIIVTTDA